MKYTVIGSGFSGLSTAAYLAKEGHEVHVFEKNDCVGGRARQFKDKGYTFDMGPSWYWMPDVFEKFFRDFDKSPKDYYDLIELNPGFQIIFPEAHTLKLSSNWNEVLELFETYEPGSSKKLILFIEEANFKYNFGINKLVYEPGVSLKEVCTSEIISNVFRLQIFKSYRKHVAKYFKNPFLIALLEFPVLFLGTAPAKTPAMYSLMAYSGIKQDGSLTVFYFNRDKYNFPEDVSDNIQLGKYRSIPVIQLLDQSGAPVAILVDSPDHKIHGMNSDRLVFRPFRSFSPLIDFTVGGWSMQVSLETVDIPVEYKFNMTVGEANNISRVSLKFVPEDELHSFLSKLL